MRKQAYCRLLLCIACLQMGAPSGAAAQATMAPVPAPNFSGRWLLDLSHSQFQQAHPPAWAEDTIQFDGVNWHFKRVLRDAAGKADAWSIDLVVGAHKDYIVRNGPLTERWRVLREGGSIVMTESLTASDGQKGESTIRYSLSPDNDLLVVLEMNKMPGGNAVNRWIFQREVQ